jgi:transcriptional regulator GlxA family with amidase domain
MPDVYDRPPQRHIAMLAFDGSEVLDICGPLDAFYYADRWLRELGRVSEPVYPARILGPASGPIVTSSGMRIMVDQAFCDVDVEIDTLLVAGGEIDAARSDPALLAWLKQTAGSARRTASICTGAFLLAASGVLDGRRATTHWYYCNRLAKDFPTIQMEPDRIFVRDGAVYTTGGITSGIDLALAMIEEDWGTEIALLVARTLVVFLKRPGGQSQFSTFLLNPAKTRRDFQELQSWIISNPGADLSLEKLAARMAMSPRNFARVFEREVGMTPGKYVELVRLEAARCQLEQTNLLVDEIATECGFGNPERLRRTFQRRLKVSPQDYRARFRSTLGLERSALGEDQMGTPAPQAPRARNQFQ